MKIVIIGTGNTATVLGRKIHTSGHAVLQVVGRNETSTGELAGELQCAATTDPANIDRNADLYIIAIADKALPTVHEWLQLDKKMVVHTAAAVPKDVLRKLSRNYGVLYPLQTLRKEQKHLPEIPFLVDGNTADDLALVQDFAGTLSSRVLVADDATRLKMHVAAVFASNFTNHLYVLAEDFCKKEQMEFSLLLPLIAETARRLEELSPRASQTGPAMRNDNDTIQRHLQILSDHPPLKEIYERLTRSIGSFGQ
jgi:predicted short-subunit dehydrogenase-like oxidoreductase (DUF2520 family)